MEAASARLAQAAVEAATAELRRTQLAYESNIDGVNTRVAQLQAELAAAQYDLERPVIRAQSDGMVTEVTLRDVLPAMSEGSVQSGSELVLDKTLVVPGGVLAIIDLHEDLSDYDLPRGVQGEAIIISHNDSMHIFSITRLLDQAGPAAQDELVELCVPDQISAWHMRLNGSAQGPLCVRQSGRTENTGSTL